MKQREVQDRHQVRWTVVQALSGDDSAAADAAERRLEDGNGHVPVVATPSGGERTRRLQLPTGWDEALSDEDLLQAIEHGGDGPA